MLVEKIINKRLSKRLVAQSSKEMNDNCSVYPTVVGTLVWSLKRDGKNFKIGKWWFIKVVRYTRVSESYLKFQIVTGEAKYGSRQTNEKGFAHPILVGTVK